MSVPITTSPQAGPEQRRLHIRRWLTAAAGTVIATAGIAIATGQEPDASRTPISNPASSSRTGPTYPNYPHDYYLWFNDPSVVKGAHGAPIR